MIGLSLHKVIRQILREELAIIENRILEKNLAAKKKAEKRAKNIAVSSICRHKMTKMCLMRHFFCKLYLERAKEFLTQGHDEGYGLQSRGW